MFSTLEHDDINLEPMSSSSETKWHSIDIGGWEWLVYGPNQFEYL